MRKVAVFLNQCLPLSEIFVLSQAKALKKYTPFFVASRRSKPSIEVDLPEFILNETGSLSEKIQEAFFKFTGLSSFLQKVVTDADIIHAHFGPTGWMASRIAKKNKKPLIVTFHGFDVLKDKVSLRKDGVLQFLYAANKNRLAKDAAAFICVSEYVRKRAIEFGFPVEKCRTIYMGIPLPAYTEPKPAHIDGTPYKLFAAGRLVPFKGHSKLIEAVALVQKAGYNVELEIAGDGPLRTELEAQAAREITNYKFHGAKKHSDMLTLMRGSDIFCHTSMHMENGQTEAFGLVLLEAQWAGLPVVAFASGGVPEAVSSATGILCPEGDVLAFASAIIKMIDEPQLRERMGLAAPLFVKNHFDIEIQSQKLEAFYDKVLAA